MTNKLFIFTLSLTLLTTVIYGSSNSLPVNCKWDAKHTELKKLLKQIGANMDMNSAQIRHLSEKYFTDKLPENIHSYYQQMSDLISRYKACISTHEIDSLNYQSGHNIEINGILDTKLYPMISVASDAEKTARKQQNKNNIKNVQEEETKGRNSINKQSDALLKNLRKLADMQKQGLEIRNSIERQRQEEMDEFHKQAAKSKATLQAKMNLDDVKKQESNGRKSIENEYADFYKQTEKAENMMQAKLNHQAKQNQLKELESKEKLSIEKEDDIDYDAILQNYHEGRKGRKSVSFSSEGDSVISDSESSVGYKTVSGKTGLSRKTGSSYESITSVYDIPGVRRNVLIKEDYLNRYGRELEKAARTKNY